MNAGNAAHTAQCMHFSVVIPTYNRRHLLVGAIDSALEQHGPGVGPVEVLVVDDGSTDGSVAWLEEIYAGRPVRVLRNAGAKGPAGGRNTGLAAARGDAVALLDSDDRFLPGHLAQAVAVFSTHPQVDVVFGRARYERGGVQVDYMGPNFERKLTLAPKSFVDDNVSVFDAGFFEHLLEYGCWFNLSSVVLRANAAALRMEETLRVAEDYEFWVRLSRRHGFACLHAPQIRYTLGDDNISFEADAATSGHSQQLLRAYCLIAAYDGLDARQRGLVQSLLASVLFDWGYRCRLAGDRLESLRLHARSLRHGRRAENLAAMAKLLLPGTARP